MSMPPINNLQSGVAGTHGEVPRLANLPFMDLYLRIDVPGEARYRSPARDESNTWSRPLPPEYLAEAAMLARQIKAELGEPDSSYVYEGMRFRLSYNQLASGAEWVILRKIIGVVPSIDKLGYNGPIERMLLNLGRRHGLILISGATGHGKTTTSFALLREFLIRNGGVALTIEDPVEYQLEGPVGEHGFCYQVQVAKGEDWASPLKRALRWTPRYILVGEVRSPAAAEQLLRAATTGHTVITTIHAGTIEESLMGLMHLAEQSMGYAANHMLAQALTAALHQTLGVQGPYVRYVVTEEDNNGDAVRALIRDDKVGMINTYIDKQIAKMNTLAAAMIMPDKGKR